MGSTPISPTNFKEDIMLLLHIINDCDDVYCNKYTDEFLSNYVKQMNMDIVNYLVEYLDNYDRLIHKDVYVY